MAKATTSIRIGGLVGAVALITALGTSAAASGEGPGPGRASYRSSFVAAVSGGRGSSGLAVFSTVDGHLTKWLHHSTRGPLPIAISPDGRWVYYYNSLTLPLGGCPKTGFAEPTLWRVRASGGRPQRTGLRATNIGFNPHGRMSADASVQHGGRIMLSVWLVHTARNQSDDDTASIATERAGSAVLIQGGLHAVKIWRWSGVQPVLIVSSSAARTTFSPLWLR